MKELTKGYVLDKKQVLPILMNDISLITDFTKQYYLILISILPNFSKIIIYPIKFKKVLKIVLSGSYLDENSIKELSLLFNKIIHTSGIVNIKDFFVYEIFIADLSEELNEFNIYKKKIRNIAGIEYIEMKWLKKK